MARSVKPKFTLRRYFITGLVILLPIVITIYLLAAIFRFTGGALGNYINVYLQKIIGFSIPGLGTATGLLIIVLLIFATGIFATNFLGRKLFPYFERLFSRLPLIRKIYHPAKQIVNFLFSTEKVAFKRVVMVEYPRRGIYSLAFITNEGMKETNEKTGEDLLNVFMPFSPTPITGYFTLVPRRDVIFLDMTIEEGLRLIISGGVLRPEDVKKERLQND